MLDLFDLLPINQGGAAQREATQAEIDYLNRDAQAEIDYYESQNGTGASDPYEPGSEWNGTPGQPYEPGSEWSTGGESQGPIGGLDLFGL